MVKSERFEDFDVFIRKYEQFENESVEDLIKRNSFSETELAHTISHLIHHRESMKDYELEKLQIEADEFMEKINDAKKKPSQSR